jgi:hypothetical protein
MVVPGYEETIKNYNVSLFTARNPKQNTIIIPYDFGLTNPNTYYILYLRPIIDGYLCQEETTNVAIIITTWPHSRPSLPLSLKISYMVRIYSKEQLSSNFYITSESAQLHNWA